MSEEKKLNPIFVKWVIIGVVGWVLFLAISPDLLINDFIKDKAPVEKVNPFIKIAEKVETRFEIAENAGNVTQAYIEAGYVAAAYRQADDELNYRKWIKIQKSLALKAGLR